MLAYDAGEDDDQIVLGSSRRKGSAPVRSISFIHGCF